MQHSGISDTGEKKNSNNEVGSAGQDQAPMSFYPSLIV